MKGQFLIVQQKVGTVIKVLKKFQLVFNCEELKQRMYLFIGNETILY